MRFKTLLLACVLTSSTAYAATDPFIGTWVYNRDKSPQPTIIYKIKDLGSGRYSLTGSGGNITEIKADGVSITGPQGEKVSFKKLDDHDWQMIRFDPYKMVRTYSISADDKTLKLNDVFTLPNGKQDTTLFTYARLSPGRSIFGEWKSISMKEESTAEPNHLSLTSYGKDGLSLTSSFDKNRLDMNLDGKQYFEIGPTARKGDATSGKRVNAHLIMLDSLTNGELESKDEWKVSDDGKTLTMTLKPVKSSAVFISVYDRR